MSESINNNQNARQETLKQIIKDLHNGVKIEKLQKKFKKLIEDTSPEEIAAMENALIQEGFPASEVQRLCDVHARVFDKALKKVGKSANMPGHPVHTYIEENKKAKKILKSLIGLSKKLKKEANQQLIGEFTSQFKIFKDLEKHYQRKENQLFPMLEAKQFTGPTQVMWGKHDEIRELIRNTDKLIKNKEWNKIHGQIKELSGSVKRLIFLEEKILFPTSEKKLNEAEWAKMKMGESEIGYAWVTPSNLWDANLAKAVSSTLKVSAEHEKMIVEGVVNLSQGKLSADQINLMLKNMPVDITFVDENDKVLYYSDTEHRIFPRSPAIIGRAVQNCHPPNSVHVVEDILKKFKEKKKKSAEFWIQMEGKFIHIRYFPVFDKKGDYRGVIEFSQEISGIRALEGEKRLLDWKK